jgi:hypothetical protein
MVEATAVSHCIIFNMMKEAITWQKQKVPWENNWPATSHWQTLSHNDMLYGVHLAWTEFELTSVISTDCIGSYKSNYHATTTAKEKGGWGHPNLFIKRWSHIYILGDSLQLIKWFSLLRISCMYNIILNNNASVILLLKTNKPIVSMWNITTVHVSNPFQGS